MELVGCGFGVGEVGRGVGRGVGMGVGRRWGWYRWICWRFCRLVSCRWGFLLLVAVGCFLCPCFVALVRFWPVRCFFRWYLSKNRVTFFLPEWKAILNFPLHILLNILNNPIIILGPFYPLNPGGSIRVPILLNNLIRLPDLILIKVIMVIRSFGTNNRPKLPILFRYAPKNIIFLLICI